MTVLMIREYPSVLKELDEMFDSFETECVVNEFTPGMNMVEDKDELIVRMELPGVKKEDVDITVDGRLLSIKAEKKSPKFSAEAKYYTCEQCFGTYSRSVELPFDVSADKISTCFEDGLLEVRLPRTEESKPRHISVTGARKQIRGEAKSK